WTVLEMSSYQLNDLKMSPHIAVVLMITSEHLDYHKAQENYINAKRNILKFQTSQDFAVINKDYPTSNESDIHTLAKVFRTSREREVGNGCFVNEKSIWVSRDGKAEKIIDIEKIKLLGRHNLENVCAANCAAILAGVSVKNIAKVLEEFGGLEHRLEFVGEKNGTLFYNDSLATVPEATIQALETLPETETLIAGGYDRGLDYSSLAQYLNKGQIKTLILFPPTGDRIWKAICNATSESNRPEKFDVRTMEQAVGIAVAETLPGKICLLSPASASFGIFKDYKDRGEQFKNAVLTME
ncbi:MAG: UDP-N-acetylmuramoylalanine--D-glutamate ligase, partial [Candidatus Portnoybacteria bacterium RIFCSPHIGHO2_01_FULL_40_12b]